MNKEVQAASGGESYSQWSQNKNRALSQSLEKRIKEMYQAFKGSKKNDGRYSREEKLSLMRDAFSIELGNNLFASNEQVFPAFYA